jgi:hypothetical protein
MASLLNRILPKEESFFAMFVDLAENVHQGAETLRDLLKNYTDIPVVVDRMKRFEHKGDELTHELMTKLNQTFITPIDREDIHELCSKVDDVLDLADAVAARLVTYGVTKVRPGVADLAEVLAQATAVVLQAVRVLEQHDGVLPHCIEINRLENEGDRLSRILIAQLFKDERDPVEIIKWKEIIEVLETAIDKCEDVANVLETICLKNA